MKFKRVKLMGKNLDDVRQKILDRGMEIVENDFELVIADKEAAAVFTALGYYPIIKPKMDKLPFKWPIKVGYFNIVILLMYYLLLNLFGMAELVEEFAEMGVIMTIVTLALGNFTFLLLDQLLGRDLRFRKRHG